MHYASVAHVQDLNPLPSPFGPQTNPNTSQVHRLIGAVEGEIDGLLAHQGYEVPVPTTATAAYALLSHYTALGAYALSEQARENSPYADDAMAAWAETKKMLRDGLIELPGAPADVDTGSASGNVNATPMFEIDMDL